jgi:hypothetical protein
MMALRLIAGIAARSNNDATIQPSAQRISIASVRAEARLSGNVSAVADAGY